MWIRSFNEKMNNFINLIKELETLHSAKGMIGDLHCFYTYTKERNFKNVLEFGVLHGNSTRTWACAASELPDTHITSVDIEQGCLDETLEKLKNDGLDKYVTLIKSNSVDFLKVQPDDYYDCIFIDTDHRYAQTVTELFLAAKKVKQKGGFIFMHDTCMPEVREAIGLFKSYMPIKHYMLDTPAGLDILIMESAI
jgi:predicted O-methyltransferase YrrM